MPGTLIPDLPFPDYLARPGISASVAHHALNSIQLVRDVLDGNAHSGDRPCLEVGRIAHVAILEPERYERCRKERGPINARTGEPYARDTKAFAEWQKANPDWIAVPDWIARALDRMPAEVREIVTGRGGSSEVSAFADLHHLGLTVKCRPDRLLTSLCYDVKTIADARSIDREIDRRAYWFTNGWYRMALKAATTQRYGHEFIFCEKYWPFRWRIVPLDAEWTMRADATVERVLGEISTAMQRNEWADTGDVRQMAGMPAYYNDEDDETTEDE